MEKEKVNRKGGAKSEWDEQVNGKEVFGKNEQSNGKRRCGKWE